MYIFFIYFVHHYSQQRSAVRSTALTQNNINIGRVVCTAIFQTTTYESMNILHSCAKNKKKYGAHSHVHLLS